MKDSIVIGLLQNTAILLALSYVYEFWWNKNDEPKSILNKIITGFIIGLIGVVLMLTPWILVPGLVFDTRSVVLSVSGLFFGKLPTIIAMIITGSYRLYLGGEGVWMGTMVVITSGTIGLIWNRYRPLIKSKHNSVELISLGFVVHLFMLGCTIFLPSEIKMNTIRTIAIPILTVYPVATLLLGTLMFSQYKNWQNKRAVDKLRESERRFTELLANTFLYSLIVNEKGEIIFCNKSFLDASGYTFKELAEKSLFDTLIPLESKEEFRMLFQNALTGNEGTLNFEADFLTKNGTKILVSINCTLLKDEDGKIAGIAGIGENITRRKQTEKELINAKIKAEESDHLKSIFLANMSHEIRTPMNSIMGFSSLLGENNLSEESKYQYIEIINKSSIRLLQLINDIIDLSKIEAKQLSINLSECNLFDILTNSIEAFRKSELLLKKPEIELILSLPSKYRKIKFISDVVRVEQVLDNLISNAIKYSHRGKIETGCSIKSETDMEVIEFYVKDSGLGISQEMGKIVFERFRQVEEGRFHEGAGLGLSISKGIIELLGGKIWFTSEVNKGSTFYFSIPYIISQKSSEEVQKTTISIPAIQGKNIIIAEDDYNSYKYLHLVLQGYNANITYAENGKVLMDMIMEQAPDLILLDINMPVMSGFDVLDEIKNRDLKIKIIAQTAYAMPEEKERCLSSGCHGYIAKPIKKEVLYRVINEVL